MTDGASWWPILTVALTTISTLFGVLWTQYRADVRERQRTRDEERKRLNEQLLTTYRELFEVMEDELYRGVSRHRNKTIWTTLELLAPRDVVRATEPLFVDLDALSTAIAHHGGGTPEFDSAREAAAGAVARVKSVIRRSLELDD